MTATGAVMLCGCATVGGPIHLPAVTIDPGGRDIAFEEGVLSDAAENPEEEIVCIVRFSAALTDIEAEELAEQAFILKGSRSDTWFLLAPLWSVTLLIHDERVEWIGPYENEYKLGRRADTIGAEKRWTNIVSFAGDHPDHRAEMNEIGIEDIRYNGVVEEYYVYINGDQIDELITMWWVREIRKAGGHDPAAAYF